MRDKDGRELATALEIKTGKHHSMSYRGQVMIYSLLIAERFINANPDNILLYIMEPSLTGGDGFEYLKQQKLELDSLVLGRNELAKWHKLNSTLIDLPRHVFSDKFKKNGDEIGAGAPLEQQIEPMEESAKWDTIKVVKLPAMISRVQECKGCFSKEVCTLAAISIEADIPRKDPVGKFQAF